MVYFFLFDASAAPILTRLTSVVVKATVDESKVLAAKYGIQSIPAFVVLKNGEVKEQFAGVVTKHKLVKSVQSHLN